MQFDWKRLFLSADGRIGRQDFWISAAILIVAGLLLGLLLGWIPVVGSLIGLVLMYPWTCIAAKRLHDFGKSGWLAAIPIGLYVICQMVAGIARLMVGGATLVAGTPGAVAGGIVAGVGLGLVLMVVLVIDLVFLIWVGVSPSDTAENMYGSPAAPAFTTQPPSAV